MADFKIGTEFADGKFYAGPNYGFVEKQEYEELNKNGNLQVGQQFYDRGVKNLKNRFSSTYNLLPEDVRNTINSNGKGLLATASQIASDAWAVQDPEHKKHAEIGANIVSKTLDLPAEIIHQSSKPFTDGRGVSKDLINVGEIVIPITGGLLKNVAKKGGPRLLQKIDDVSDAFRSSKQFAGATVGQVPTNGRIKVPTNGNGGNGGNGVNVVHKPLQITVDPKYQEIGPGFTQRTDIQKHLNSQNLRIKKTKDTELINRNISTPPDKIDPSVLVYGRDKFKNALYDLHHMDAKGETGAIFKLMREIGDEEDVVNLYAYMALRGVGGGDKMSNLLYMNKPAHWKIHKWRRNQKLEIPSNVLYKTLKEQVGGDTNKLMAIVDEMIGDNFIVSRSKALQFQKEFVDEFKQNKLKLVSPKNNLRVIKRRSEKLSVEELYESIPDHYFDKGLTI